MTLPARPLTNAASRNVAPQHGHRSRRCFIAGRWIEDPDHYVRGVDLNNPRDVEL